MTPRIYVGTLYSNEGDFMKCCEAIKTQKNVIVEHHVISGLPELNAHNALWDAWENKKDSFDLFVKVDADTVLLHDNVLYDAWNVFQQNPTATGMQTMLHDYFTDKPIFGLNFFTTRVKFVRLDDKLYCDRADVNNTHVLKRDAVPEKLRPYAGLHCHHASENQAFHFGVHRALKKQTQVLADVKAAWHMNCDRLRGFALLGASYVDEFRGGSFNYTDDAFKRTFESVSTNYDTLIKERIK